MNQNRTITIKIGGEAGFGIKVAGASLGMLLSRMGYQAFDYTEYPSLIRGGHNTFEITVGKKVHHHVRPVNLLIALNQQTINEHLDELSADGGIVFDPERTKPLSDKFRLFPVPFSAIAKESGGSDLVKNTVAIAAALAVLGSPVEGFLEMLRETFAKKKIEVINSNLAAATAGYDYVRKQHPDPFAYQVSVQDKIEQIYLTGNEAVALGAIAGGCRLYVGYPMTPSSSLLGYMAQVGPKAGVLVRQPEDEIAALNCAIGAGWAGIRSMVGTSGGGFSLMTEALGLAGITETPVVIFMGQRPGPATGLPTWSGQADLRFLLHAAQDEFPRIILAPGDQEECFYLTAEAFNLAEKFQCPVFVMSDKNLAEGGKTIPVFDQSRIAIDRGAVVTEEDIKAAGEPYRRFKVTDSGVSPRALPGTAGGVHAANSDEHDEYGYNIEDIPNRNAQMEKRMRKLQTAVKDLPDPNVFGPKEADLTVVSWGSTKGTILQALNELGEKPVNFIHFTHLWPFPTPTADKLLREAKKLLVVENNFAGQFDGMIRQYVGRVPEERLLKYDGRPFWPHEIVEKLKAIV